jgi:hypothetical protein
MKEGIHPRMSLGGHRYEVRRVTVSGRREWHLVDVTDERHIHVASLQLGRGEGNLSLYRQHVSMRLIRFMLEHAVPSVPE